MTSSLDSDLRTCVLQNDVICGLRRSTSLSRHKCCNGRRRRAGRSPLPGWLRVSRLRRCLRRRRRVSTWCLRGTASCSWRSVESFVSTPSRSLKLPRAKHEAIHVLWGRNVNRNRHLPSRNTSILAVFPRLIRYTFPGYKKRSSRVVNSL